jgi:DNA-binding MarR family transcriptional regulator
MKKNDFDLFSPELVRLAKKLHEMKNQKLTQHDIKVTNARCLCRIAASGEEGMSATQLSQMCDIDKAQISRCMLELIERQYVYRGEEEGKCYKQKYHLTEAGKRITDDLMASALEIRCVLGEGISDEEMMTFGDVLDRICANFTKNYQKK